jgi:hypothetical protein
MTELAVENTEFTSAEKARISRSQVKTMFVCVFVRQQVDSSLRMHCTRTNGKSTVLFGSADKIMEMCSEGKTWTLT